MADTLRNATSFARSASGVEGCVMRIGARSAAVILVAASGQWLRVVVASPDAGRVLCEHLGITCRDGWPDDLRRRVTAWRRTPQDWARAPYPEAF